MADSLKQAVEPAEEFFGVAGRYLGSPRSQPGPGEGGEEEQVMERGFAPQPDAFKCLDMLHVLESRLDLPAFGVTLQQLLAGGFQIGQQPPGLLHAGAQLGEDEPQRPAAVFDLRVISGDVVDGHLGPGSLDDLVRFSAEDEAPAGAVAEVHQPGAAEPAVADQNRLQPGVGPQLFGQLLQSRQQGPDGGVGLAFVDLEPEGYGPAAAGLRSNNADGEVSERAVVDVQPDPAGPRPQMMIDQSLLQPLGQRFVRTQPPDAGQAGRLPGRQAPPGGVQGDEAPTAEGFGPGREAASFAFRQFES